MSFTVPIGDVQPSQLYVDAAKFRRAVTWFSFENPEYEPIPVLEWEDDIVLSDGHTRAFLAHLSGAATLNVVSDPDREELNLDLYRECVNWCRDEEISSIGDLSGRIVSHDTFVEKWIGRCQRSPSYEGD